MSSTSTSTGSSSRASRGGAEADLGEATDITGAPSGVVLDGPSAATLAATDEPTERVVVDLSVPRDDLDEQTERITGKALQQALVRAMPTPSYALPLPRPATQPEGTRPPPILARGSAPELGSDRMLGKYRLTHVLASGGMGVVYRAEHPSLRTPVAIKAVHGQLQQNPAIAARFFAESVAMSRVVHPNVVRFHDFGYDASGSAFLVMELLEGETLSSRLARERQLDVATAVDIAIQICHGLSAAHTQGVIHRDLKPDNVFLCSPRGGLAQVKLLDFGVAKLEGQGAMQTRQGDLLGTPAYMAPEQGRAASESDARSDLYSVGCMLFEMVCGVVPFPGNLVETLVGHQTADRPPARALNPNVPPALDALIDRLLAREPGARPQSATEVVGTLVAIESAIARPMRQSSSAFRSRTQIVRAYRGAPSAAVYIAVIGFALALGCLVTLMMLR